MATVPIIPGRGLVTPSATQMRWEYLASQAFSTCYLSETNLELEQIRNNIESYIGSTEIPVGILGPLVYKSRGQIESVYAVAATLEGALVASMNRGARVISKSGGFTAELRWQKMVRAPLFIFNAISEASDFKIYVEQNFDKIKSVAESYSNHAQLQIIKTKQLETSVQLRFEYKTGDASGQNMTTTCTWHAMLFLKEAFKSETGITPRHAIIEGNGASDKKISNYNIQHGRGIHVMAECCIPENLIQQLLRTTSEAMYECYKASQKFAQQDGMLGYNINVTNAIAALFAATGQDLASIHESGTGFLNLKKTSEGLEFQLTLPNLVIGTIGGGTAIPKQSQALDIMKCNGTGAVERFAKLIAGFALGLEISTFAAIVSGEFAKAHEKLGRNKPVKWFLPSELTPQFVQSKLNGSFQGKHVHSVELKHDFLDNGILSHISSKVTKKWMGLTSLELKFINEKAGTQNKRIMLKSKPLDSEVLKGLHRLAASIDPKLSDTLKKNFPHLEYCNSHRKELEVYQYINKKGYAYCPKVYGTHCNAKREMYLLFQDYLEAENMQLFNSENWPELWTQTTVYSVIKAITKAHQNLDYSQVKSLKEFQPWKAKELYQQLLRLLIAEIHDSRQKADLQRLFENIDDLYEERRSLKIAKTLIHNDCNPRNIAIDQSGQPIIYDWELAMIDIPHRDIVEFLSFVLPVDF